MVARGRVLYLVEQRAPLGSGRYVVRAYDLARAALRPGAIADKRNLDSVMSGRPAARDEKPDGTVIATLYVREHNHPESGRHGPFLHLLYAEQGNAVCVDLPDNLDPEASVRWVAGRFVVTDGAGLPTYVVDPENGALSRAAA